MNEYQARSLMLIGGEAVQRLKDSHVAVFGLGGVGGYALEALARSGVGSLTLVDGDVVSPSNLNRQIIALSGNVGASKAQLAAQRVRLIDPEIQVIAKDVFYTPQTAGQFDLSEYDYVLDCVDMVAAKLELAQRAQAAGTAIISAMGAGNKLDPGMLQVADISQTSICPLARVMRKLLKARGIERLTVVYSRETPRCPLPQAEANEQPGLLRRRCAPGSMVFVPAAMGMMMAAHAVQGLIADPQS